MDYKSKGATYLDKLCHKLYDEPKGNGIKVSGECHRCGGPLSAYYCEERLYLIACEECGTVVLTKACSPQIAANLTIVEKDANAQNLRVSKIIARAEAAEKRVEELEKSLSDAAQVVKTMQERTIPYYRNRAEAAEKEAEWKNKVIEAAERRFVEAEARAEKAERERDAAVRNLSSLEVCGYCKNGQCTRRGGTKECKFEWVGSKED